MLGILFAPIFFIEVVLAYIFWLPVVRVSEYGKYKMACKIALASDIELPKDFKIGFWIFLFLYTLQQNLFYIHNEREKTIIDIIPEGKDSAIPLQYQFAVTHIHSLQLRRNA